MHFFGIHILDAFVILASVAAIIIVGIRASRGVKKASDFFAGGRKMGGFLQFFLNFAQMTDSSGAPTVATGVYNQGAGGMWPAYQPLFNTPFYWFSSIWYRRTRLITNSDLFLERFNSRRLATALVWWFVMLTPILGGLGNIVSFKVASAMFLKPEAQWTASERQSVVNYREYQHMQPDYRANRLPPAARLRYDHLDTLQKRGELASYISYIRPLPFYIVYTAVVVSYIIFGGLKAAAYTNAVQGILIIALSFLLIPVGLTKVGGFHALHQIVPAEMFNLFGGGNGDYTWYSIVAFLLMGLVCLGDPVVNPSGRDESAMRVGQVGAAFGKRLVMIAWMFCGLLAVALFPNNSIADPDNAWGLLSIRLLGPGLLGLMISGILLGHMPAVAWSAIQFSAMFTRNLYEPAVRGRTPQHYRFVAQAAIVLVLTVSIVTALYFTDILALFTAIVAIRTMLSAIGLLMLFWRRLTALATGLGWMIWLVLIVAIPWLLPLSQTARRLPSLTRQTDARTAVTARRAQPGDVQAGRARAVGDSITETQAIPRSALFFESVARIRPDDPSSPLEGLGRFHTENYLFYCAGVPLHKFNAAGLKSARWLFDALAPFPILMALSFLPRRRRGASTSPPRTPTPEEHARTIMQGNISFMVCPNETGEEEQIRLDRFFAKQRTPIAPTPEEDECELMRTFEHPERFDHCKLFPNSSWEFTKWTRSDILGFGGCWLGVFAVLGIIQWVLGIGG